MANEQRPKSLSDILGENEFVPDADAEIEKAKRLITALEASSGPALLRKLRSMVNSDHIISEHGTELNKLLFLASLGLVEDYLDEEYILNGPDIPTEIDGYETMDPESSTPVDKLPLARIELRYNWNTHFNMTASGVFQRAQGFSSQTWSVIRAECSDEGLITLQNGLYSTHYGFSSAHAPQTVLNPVDNKQLVDKILGELYQMQPAIPYSKRGK